MIFLFLRTLRTSYGLYKFIIYCVHNCTNEEKGHRNLHKNLLSVQLTWRRTVLMKELMAGLNLSHSLSSRPIPLKHHSRMPPLLKIVKKSNMLTRLQLFDYYVDINSWQVTNLESRPYMAFVMCTMYMVLIRRLYREEAVTPCYIHKVAWVLKESNCVSRKKKSKQTNVRNTKRKFRLEKA